MQHPIIFFDGVCNLCNRSVQFVIKRDKRDLFRFKALQDEDMELNSITLVENGKTYKHSTAVLRIARHLNGLWPLLYVFIVIPAFIRDYFYKLIAKNRYKVWGRTAACMVPSPEVKHKFLS